MRIENPLQPGDPVHDRRKGCSALGISRQVRSHDAEPVVVGAQCLQARIEVEHEAERLRPGCVIVAAEIDQSAIRRRAIQAELAALGQVNFAGIGAVPMAMKEIGRRSSNLLQHGEIGSRHRRRLPAGLSLKRVDIGKLIGIEVLVSGRSVVDVGPGYAYHCRTL